MNNKPGKHKKLEINLEQDVERPDIGFKVTLQKPAKIKAYLDAVSYTHLTLPTKA